MPPRQQIQSLGRRRQAGHSQNCREADENRGGLVVPMAELLEHADKLPAIIHADLLQDRQQDQQPQKEEGKEQQADLNGPGFRLGQIKFQAPADDQGQRQAGPGGYNILSGRRKG